MYNLDISSGIISGSTSVVWWPPFLCWNWWVCLWTQHYLWQH